jgi:hypothetical protein
MTLSRHYYHCQDCKHGFFPWDQILHLGSVRQTPAAQEVIALTGAVDSFPESADRLIQKLSGLKVSESTIQRVTESVGARIGEAQKHGEVFGESTPWKWHRDADGKTVGYVSVDATGVGIQGPHGAKAEGRMINIGMIYNPIPEETARRAEPDRRQPPWQARYVTGMNDWDTLGQSLRRQAGQVGMDSAQRWVAISDGGNGLEAFLQTNFPRVEAVILDFYHAAEYLGAIGRAWHPGDDEQSKAWSQSWCHDLKHAGGAAVLARLRSLVDESPPPAVRGPLGEAITYFGNQVHRMDYPTYRERGWQIGSGSVESACKSVIGARMKQAGMRWGTDGAEEVAHIRGLFRGELGQWDAFWSPNQPLSSPRK